MRATIRQATMQLFRSMVQSFHGKLAHASSWLFVGGIAAGILGYVFQVLMGRMLSTEEYGLFSAMMALFAVLAAPLGALMMVVSLTVSGYRAKQDSGSITHFYYSINIRAAGIGALIMTAYFLSSSTIQIYLKSPSIFPVYLLGALSFLTLLPVINNAFLQGLQRFVWLSFGSSFGVLLKIGFSVVLVWLGYGVAGALGGAILAVIVGWLVTYGALHHPLKEGKGLSFKATDLSIKSALPVLGANVAFAAMTQLDVVLVNYYFPAHEAGLYAAAAVLGKAVLYLPGGIAMALFPMVAENHSRNQSSAHLLLQAVALTALLSGAGATFYFLFGEALIALIYGENYRAASGVLKLYGFAIFPMALVMVAEYFLIAKGKVLFAYLFLFTVPLQLTAMHLFRDSLQMVVAVVGASGSLLALLGYGILWRAYKAGGGKA